jgi:hypothetical protein
MSLLAVVAVAMILVVPCFGQSSSPLPQKPFVVQGISLHISFHAFQMKIPGAQCMAYHVPPKGKSCMFHNTVQFGGLTSSKANFNFDVESQLTSIGLWFYPAPSNREIQQMMESLKKDYGAPTEQKDVFGKTMWRWSRRGSQMILTMPSPSWDELTIDIGERTDRRSETWKTVTNSYLGALRLPESWPKRQPRAG